MYAAGRVSVRMYLRFSFLGPFLYIATNIALQVCFFPGKPLIRMYQNAYPGYNGLETQHTSAENGSIFGKRLHKNGSQSRNHENVESQPKDHLDGMISQINREKPLLLLHIGPPKTATTTLQNGFQEFRDQLLHEDRIYYCDSMECGNLAHKIGTCGVKSNMTVADACWMDLRQRLQNLPGRMRNKSHVLFSAEPMSIGVKKWQHRLNRRAPIDWLSVRDQLGKDWRIVIIMGYRRFVDWLPSSEQQIWRWTVVKPSVNNWPLKNGGRRVVPLFPEKWKTVLEFGKYKYTPTNLLFDNIDSLLPVILFNMHDGGDILSTINENSAHGFPRKERVSLLSRFLCKTLLEAGILTNFTCEESLICDAKTRQEIVVNPSQTLFYDSLSVAAYDKHLIPELADRHRVAVLIQEFQNDSLNQTYRDFPLICPSQHEMKLFLNYSLEFESRLLPEFYKSSQGAGPHAETFWKSVEQKKYCFIDTDAVLVQERWKSFFQNLSKTPQRYLGRTKGARTRLPKKK